MSTLLTQRHALDADGAGLAAGRLSEQDRPGLLAHLLRLSDDDRRMRFMSWTSDASIAAYVASRDLRATLTFGVRTAAGLLVAVAEGSPYRAEIEIAFTTDPAWRRLGLARSLLDLMVRTASDEGYERIVAQCDARNRPLRSLLLSSGAASRVDGPEVSATWPLLPSDAVEDLGQPRVAGARGRSLRPQAGAAGPRTGVQRREEPT